MCNLYNTDPFWPKWFFVIMQLHCNIAQGNLRITWKTQPVVTFLLCHRSGNRSWIQLVLKDVLVGCDFIRLFVLVVLLVCLVVITWLDHSEECNHWVLNLTVQILLKGRVRLQKKSMDRSRYFKQFFLNNLTTFKK